MNASLRHMRWQKEKLDVQVAYSMAIKWTNRRAGHDHVDTEGDAYASLGREWRPRYIDIALHVTGARRRGVGAKYDL